MNRSHDPEVLRKAVEPYPELTPPTFDFEGFVADDNNKLFEEDGSVGFATYEFPGVYNVHWFFKVRGKKALSLAQEMLNEMFEKYGAQTVIGLTPENIMPARVLAKKIGFVSQGLQTMADSKVYEMMTLNKADFYKGYDNGRR